MPIISGGGGSSSSLPKGYITGLALEYLSATTVRVKSGKARDKADAADITLGSDTTVDITTLGAATGLDRFQSGTCDSNNGSTTVTLSTSIVTGVGGGRTLTGTHSSSSTALTGSGSKYLTELSVGDVVGNSTAGYARVTAIASDTAATLVAATPTANISAGSSIVCLENLTCRIPSNVDTRVNTITNTGTTIVTQDAAGATLSGQAFFIGVEVVSGWYAVWVASGGSGTTAILSTQRTTPYGVTGYTTAYRRAGWVYNNASKDMSPFSASGDGSTRRVQWEAAQGGAYRVIDNGTGSTNTWVPYALSTVAPPTARRVGALVQRSGGVSMTVAFRPRATGVTTTSRNTALPLVTDGDGGLVEMHTDAAQVIEAAQTAGTTGVFADFAHYIDEL